MPPSFPMEAQLQQFQTYQSRLPAPQDDARPVGLGFVEAVLWVLIMISLIAVIRMAAALSVDLAGVVTQAQAMGGM
ncbi:hypothetical protein [Fuscibacter oryzae]|uniref:Uncharacterized protein n=1 Tax=Fuscibacter oryzae TaxID=2803939 RepID=A0A8J7MVM2_9RHOB|nr:hypothetical protein [Fuscibacter oryzae]MBL4929363.1 hypothetical protein [Fuscibacter oryzae]